MDYGNCGICRTWNGGLVSYCNIWIISKLVLACEMFTVHFERQTKMLEQTMANLEINEGH